MSIEDRDWYRDEWTKRTGQRQWGWQRERPMARRLIWRWRRVRHPAVWATFVLAVVFAALLLWLMPRREPVDWAVPPDPPAASSPKPRTAPTRGHDLPGVVTPGARR
jgi:hypothetical protein